MGITWKKTHAYATWYLCDGGRPVLRVSQNESLTWDIMPVEDCKHELSPGHPSLAEAKREAEDIYREQG